MATLQDVIDSLKAEGQLIRNTGTNSIKSMSSRIDNLGPVFQSIDANIASQATILSSILTSQQTPDNSLLQSIDANIASQGVVLSNIFNSQQTPDNSLLQSIDANIASQGVVLSSILTSQGAANNLGPLLQSIDANIASQGAVLSSILTSQQTPDNSLLQSIDTNIASQGAVLSNIFNSQEASRAAQERSELLTRANRSSTGDRAARGPGIIGGTLSGAGNLASGVGGLLGGVGQGVGFAGLGIGAALLGLGTVIDKLPDVGEIKNNIETLLTIGDGYESRLDFFLDGGALALMLGGLGIGLAAFAVGSGATSGVQYAIKKFEMEGWPETLKENVLTLLSIGDDLTLGNLQLLLEGGSVALALTGLGIGLTAFAVGSGAQAAVDYFSEGSDWATNVKTNVETLLSIGQNKTLGSLEVLFEGVGVSAALAGLGVGLVAFSAGQGVAAAVDYFSENDWAQTVKDSVETLLSISDLEGVGWNTAGFIGVMGGLAAGLTLFALGKGVDTTIEGYDQALNYFTSEDNFADRIYDQVETLLKIPQLEGIGVDTSKFIGVMGGLALGLSAFALGKGVEGLTEGGQEALSYFTSQEPFADRIYNQVSTLLSITDLADEGKATQFVTAMSQISTGLIAFGGGELIGSLAAAGASIVNFFSGAESPFEQVRQIYQNSEQLEQGASALDSLTSSLEKIGQLQFDGSRLRLRQMAEDLKEAVPIIEAAIMGQEGGLIWGTTIKGLASPDVDYDTAVKNIVMLRQALSGVIDENSIQGMATVNEAGSGTTQPAPIVINANNNNTTEINQRGGSATSNINVGGIGGRNELDSMSKPPGVN
jgi:hypothetical protein